MSSTLHEGWKVECLKDIADVIMGQSPPSSTYNQKGVGLPFFQGNTEFGEMTPSVNKFCSDPIKIAEANDILMSVRAPVGPVNISPLKCCIGRGLSAIRAKEGKADHLYLYFYLRSIEERLANSGQGSTFKAINKSAVEKIDVPIPNKIETQKRIASLLQKAMKLGQKRKQANQMANKLLQAIFKQRFGDPVINTLGWHKVKLIDVCSRITDGTHITPSYKDEGVIFLSAKNIQENILALDLDNVKYISIEEHKKLTKRVKPEKHDILYRKVGVGFGVARAIKTDLELSIFVSLALIKPNHSAINWKFLETMLNCKYVRDQAKLRIKGIGVPDLHLEEIRDFEIILPPLEIQNKFAITVEEVEKLLIYQKQTSIKIEELFKSLMSKAFKGELNALKVVC